MKRTFTYLILLAPLWSGAQMLNTSAPLDLQSWYQFDPAFLAAGDIDTIEVRLQTKRDGRPIKNWNDVQRMAFDDQGRLTELFQTKAVGSITDTTHWLLTYGTHDHYLHKTEHSRSGYYVLEPVLDAEGRTVEMRYDKAPAPEPGRPVRGRTRINTETFTYTKTDSTEVRTAYNNYGRPYEKRTRTFDALGYATSLRTEFLVTRRVKTEHYAYDERGRLAEVRFASSHSERTKRHVYRFDLAGSVTQIEAFENGKLVNTYEVVYDNAGRIDGILVLNAAKGSLKILNFSYPKSAK